MVNGRSAASLQEALKIRANEKVVPYAGGTDLMVENRKDVTYLFLGKVPELRQITADDEYVRIGAAVTFTEALESPLVPALMKEAVAKIAAPAIRNAGTFGGNLGNGSAKADSVLIEFVSDAKLRLVSVRGERVVDVDAFYLGRKKLDLMEDELIAEIWLPKESEDGMPWPSPGSPLPASMARRTGRSRSVPAPSARWQIRCSVIGILRRC